MFLHRGFKTHGCGQFCIRLCPFIEPCFLYTSCVSRAVLCNSIRLLLDCSSDLVSVLFRHWREICKDDQPGTTAILMVDRKKSVRNINFLIKKIDFQDCCANMLYLTPESFVGRVDKLGRHTLETALLLRDIRYVPRGIRFYWGACFRLLWAAPTFVIDPS